MDRAAPDHAPHANAWGHAARDDRGVRDGDARRSAVEGGQRRRAGGGCFEPRPGPGYTLAAFAGGGLDRLERCAQDLGSRVHATGEDGAWLTLDSGADGTSNAAFRASFADGAATGTLFLLERAASPGPIAREPGRRKRRRGGAGRAAHPGAAMMARRRRGGRGMGDRPEPTTRARPAARR